MGLCHLSAEYPRALILSGDVSSKVVPAEDVGNSVLMGDGIGAFAMEFVPEQKQQISFTLSNFPDTEFSLVNYDSGYRPVPGKPDGMVMAGNQNYGILSEQCAALSRNAYAAPWQTTFRYGCSFPTPAQ